MRIKIFQQILVKFFEKEENTLYYLYLSSFFPLFHPPLFGHLYNELGGDGCYVEGVGFS